MSAIKAGNPVFLYYDYNSGMELLGPNSHITPEMIDALKHMSYYKKETKLEQQIRSFEKWKQNPGFKVKGKKNNV